MKRLALILFLLVPSVVFADSENTIGGKTAAPSIIQDEGTSLRPRPYLNFTGSSISCSDSGGKTVCNVTGGSGGGSAQAIQESDTGVVTSADTVDYRSGFDVTEDPSGEANISLDLNEVLSGPVTSDSSNLTYMNFTRGNLVGVLGPTNGGLGYSGVTDDTVSIGSGTQWENKVLPNCTDASGSHLNYTTATNAFSCGTSSLVDALTEVAQSIKTASNDTSKIVVGASGDTDHCAKWASDGRLVSAGAACGAGGSIDGSGTTNEITYWVDSDTLGTLAVATYPSLTELSYVKGVTSAIQTQLNAKDAVTTAGRSLTRSTNDFLADVELYTKSLTWNYPANPVDTDDNKSIWCNDTANAFTVTKLKCESDQTVTMMLQVDDGTPADMDSVDLVCISTPDTDTSLDGDAEVAAGECVDVATTSVSGAPSFASVTFTGTWND